MAPVNSAAGLPHPPQEPIYEPISPEWEPMDDRDGDIPDLTDIPEESARLHTTTLGLNYAQTSN